jgi:hypothetical protein
MKLFAVIYLKGQLASAMFLWPGATIQDCEGINAKNAGEKVMFGWARKVREIATLPPQPEPQTIILSHIDPPLERARKIWMLMGFVNDRFGSVPQMAAYLSHYRDLDSAARVHQQRMTEPK